MVRPWPGGEAVGAEKGNDDLVNACFAPKRRSYFFRRRLALATARLYQGASTEAIDALPPLEISLSPDVAAARAFSRTMRWYSAGEHLFCATSSVRRAIVSHDAIIRSVIIIGSDAVLRRLQALMTNALSDDECGTTLSNIGGSDQCRHPHMPLMARSNEPRPKVTMKS